MTYHHRTMRYYWNKKKGKRKKTTLPEWGETRNVFLFFFFFFCVSFSSRLSINPILFITAKSHFQLNKFNRGHPTADGLKKNVNNQLNVHGEKLFDVGVVGPSFNLQEEEKTLEEASAFTTKDEMKKRFKASKEEMKNRCRTFKGKVKNILDVKTQIKEIQGKLRSHKFIRSYKNIDKNLPVLFPYWKGTDGIIYKDMNFLLNQGHEIIDDIGNAFGRRRKRNCSKGKTIVVEEGLLGDYEEFSSLLEGEEDAHPSHFDHDIPETSDNRYDNVNNYSNKNENDNTNVEDANVITLSDLLGNKNLFKDLQISKLKTFLNQKKSSPLLRWQYRKSGLGFKPFETVRGHAKLPYHPPHFSKNIDTVISTLFRKMLLSPQYRGSIYPIDSVGNVESENYNNLLDKNESEQERRESFKQNLDDESRSSSDESLDDRENNIESKEYIYIPLPTKYDNALQEASSREIRDPVTTSDPSMQATSDHSFHQELNKKKIAKPRPRPRPFVTISYAQSLDGSLSSGNKEKVIISGEQSTILTHAIRSMHDCILIGAETAILDNPQLNVRLFNKYDQNKQRKRKFQKYMKNKKNYSNKSEKNHLDNDEETPKALYPCPRPVVLTTRLHRFYNSDILNAQRMTNPIIFTSENSFIVDFSCQAHMTFNTIFNNFQTLIKKRQGNVTKNLTQSVAMTSLSAKEAGLYPLFCKDKMIELFAQRKCGLKGDVPSSSDSLQGPLTNENEKKDKTRKDSSIHQVFTIPRVKRYAISNIQTRQGTYSRRSTSQWSTVDSNYVLPSLKPFNAVAAFKERLSSLSFNWSPTLHSPSEIPIFMKGLKGKYQSLEWKAYSTMALNWEKKTMKRISSSAAFALAKIKENHRSFLSIWKSSNGRKILNEAGFEVLQCPVKKGSSKSKKKDDCDISFCLEQLYLMGYRSLMVEGGAEIIQAFLEEGLVDMVVVTVAPRYLGGYRLLPRRLNSSVKGESINTEKERKRMEKFRIQNVQMTQLGDDMIVYGDLKSNFHDLESDPITL